MFVCINQCRDWVYPFSKRKNTIIASEEVPNQTGQLSINLRRSGKTYGTQKKKQKRELEYDANKF